MLKQIVPFLDTTKKKDNVNGLTKITDKNVLQEEGQGYDIMQRGWMIILNVENDV